ncbi:hypothetical protein JTB14_026982 [Gonioctena quinquepunctata]|nr:hypothetical protein JTB14_026982 [Gonioctena quinquepunctata]
MVLNHTPSRIDSVYNLRSRNGGTGQGTISKDTANKSLDSSKGYQTFSSGKKQGPEGITAPISMVMSNSGQGSLLLFHHITSHITKTYLCNKKARLTFPIFGKGHDQHAGGAESGSG